MEKVIDEKQVVDAVNTLKAEGQKVTYRSIYQALGNRGSMRTIQKYVKQFELDKIEEPKEPSADLARLIKAIEVTVGDAKVKATEHIQEKLLIAEDNNKTLGDDLEVAEVERDKARKENLELKSVISSLEIRLKGKDDALKEKTEELAKAKEEISLLNRDLVKMQLIQENNEKLQVKIDELNQLLMQQSREIGENLVKEKDLTDLKAQVKDLTETIATLNFKLGQTSKEKEEEKAPETAPVKKRYVKKKTEEQ
ncbi:MAG: DNA-binding protein [Deltaproteobacteria bacterium]|nr:DNA-binding protein [Deltaproteobacteria bacterium]